MPKQFHSDPTEFGPRISYGDGKEWARVVLDSVGPHGVRVVTVEARYWRMIHSEIMTHRSTARNAASSRAIPFYREVRCPVCSETPAQDVCERCGDDGMVIADNCMYEMIDGDPFMPEFLGVEQKGMQSGASLSFADYTTALDLIDDLRRKALDTGKRLHDLGLHKSIINRYVEPWMYSTTLITATEWANFFRLRIHPKAERHFDKVARLIREAIRRSEPQQLRTGEWHTPYIRPGEASEIGAKVDQAMPLPNGEWRRGNAVNMVSAGRCARLSYLTHDGKRDFGADIELCKRLIDPKHDDGTDDETIHASPLEHVLRCEADPAHRSGPMLGWHQFRKDFPRENVGGIGPLG